MLYVVMGRDLQTGEAKEVPYFHQGMKPLTKAKAWKLAYMMEQAMYMRGIRQPFWATPVLDI